MPIRRWHGWCAICKKCGKSVDLGDGMLAFEEKQEVRDAITDFGYMTDSIEELITDLCRCLRKEAK